jgi:hypothetical protein
MRKNEREVALVSSREQAWQDKVTLLHGQLTRASPSRAALHHDAREQHPSLARRSPSTHPRPVDRSLHLRFVWPSVPAMAHTKMGPSLWEASSSTSTTTTTHSPSCDSCCVVAVPLHASPWPDRIVRDAHPPLTWTRGSPALKPKATSPAHTASRTWCKTRVSIIARPKRTRTGS